MTLKEDKIVVSESEEITLLLISEQSIFVVLAIEWIHTQTGTHDLKQGSQKIFKSFGSQKEAEDFFDELIIKWR